CLYLQKLYCPPPVLGWHMSLWPLWYLVSANLFFFKQKTAYEIPAFQVDGVFDEQRYVITLQSQGYTPQGFQELIRDDLQASLLAGQVARSAFTTPGETERMMRLLGERRDVALVVLPAPEPDTGAVSAEEIQAWFEANRAGYRAPERVAIEYVEI